MPKIKVHIPAVFRPLLTQKKRIKFYYGGRAGGKSYAFADSLLILGRMKKLFIVCLREIQGSIRDSVHKLLSDRISYYQLSDYKVTDTKIENKVTGTVFVFKGLRDQDPQKIKSLEGTDIAWVEEAQTITKKSWDILEPTIRKPNSEIWISMNREQENDPLWVAVAVQPDENTLVQKVNYTDNPFCPQEMKDLADKCREKNPTDYAHIWLGEPVLNGNNKLIDLQSVKKAQSGHLIETSGSLIIGLDIARFGDDETVFCFRRGRICERFEAYRKKDTVEVANIVTHYIQQYRPYRIFLDIGGQGAGVYDILTDRGFREVVRGISFGEKAIQSDRYVNKRAEMWDGIRQWLTGTSPVYLPNDTAITDDLCDVNKKYDRLGRLQLEEKESLKRRLGRSPDWGDALALTFAEPIFEQDMPNLYTNDTDKISIETLFCDKREGAGW